MTTLIWMTIGLFLTTTTSIIMALYVRKVLLKLYMLQEMHDDIFVRVDYFRDHLERVHELETYYGDETIQGMIEHSKKFSDYLQGLSSSITFSYEDEEEIEEQDE